VIPTQLTQYKFCKVKRGTKVPYESNWQNKNYSYTFISKIFPQENYGVLTGIKELGILDDDTPDQKLLKLYDEHFKPTFQVRGHYYIKLKGWDGKKIILYSEDGKHLGELQGKGQQCVGAGSLHPSGEHYKVIKDIPIIEIEIENFMKVFKKFQKKVNIVEIEVLESISWSGDNINNIPISKIIYPSGETTEKGSIIQGSHPIHGSQGGSNFAIDTTKNTWYCFRCGSGGGIWSAISMAHGIKNCNDFHQTTFTTDEKKELVKIAGYVYGLKFGVKF